MTQPDSQMKIRLPAHLKASLMQYAASKGASMNQVIIDIIDDYFTLSLDIASLKENIPDKEVRMDFLSNREMSLVLELKNVNNLLDYAIANASKIKNTEDDADSIREFIINQVGRYKYESKRILEQLKEVRREIGMIGKGYTQEDVFY